MHAWHFKLDHITGGLQLAHVRYSPASSCSVSVDACFVCWWLLSNARAYFTSELRYHHKFITT